MAEASRAPVLGCVADDLTGATDLAGTLVGEGMRVNLVVGVTDVGSAAWSDADAVVIALKTRSVAPGAAVAQSMAAAEMMIETGCQHLFFKYCSTFDSTDRGNIGPVADALLARLGEDFTVAVPSFPRNGRTVYNGHLFVGETLLSESSMRHHPLTPMTDANLVRVLARQTDGRVGLVSHHIVREGVEAVRAATDRLRRNGIRYAVVDATDAQDLETVGAAFADARLTTGGSAMAGAVAAALSVRGDFVPMSVPAPAPAASADGRHAAAVLAGSCSEATLGQVAWMKQRFPAHRIDLTALAGGHDVVADAVGWATKRMARGPVLIYTSAGPERVASDQSALGADSGVLIESTLGDVAGELSQLGVDRFVVAGGETSGAVVSTLGVRVLSVGQEVAPGVPVVSSLQGPSAELVLKSGNFGSESFFLDALDALKALP